MSKSKKPEKKDPQQSELIQRFKSNPFLFVGTVIILVIVIVAFVLVPAIPDIAGGGDMPDYVFGSYDGVPIGYLPDNYFARVLDMTARNYGFRLESDYSQQFQTAMMVWQEAFMQSLVHMGSLDEMKKAGYGAPPKEIDKQVADLKEFKDDDGRFSVVKYRRYDKNRLLTLWHNVEEDYVEQKYIKDSGDLVTSSGEKSFIADMSSPMRKFRMAIFPRSSFPDSEVSAFAQFNKDPFRMVHLSRITIESSESEANQVLESIKSGKITFEDAARNQSQDSYKAQGGDTGLRMAYELYRDIADEEQRKSVLSLKAGDLSPVVKVPSGWAFFLADENPYDPDLSLPENLSKVRSYMREFEGGRMENYLVAQADEFIAEAGKKGLDAAASEKGITLKDAGPVPLNYGNVNLFDTLDTSDSPELYAAVSNENFWKNAFKTPLNSASAPFTLNDNVVVLYPTGETVKDATEKGYIGDWYARGWQYSAVNADVRSAFNSSDKFVNNFASVFFGNFFQTQFK